MFHSGIIQTVDVCVLIGIRHSSQRCACERVTGY